MKRDNGLYMFLPMTVPTTTAQTKRVMVRHGKPIFYDCPRMKAAREAYKTAMLPHRLKEPMQGPIAVCVEFLFETKDKKRCGKRKHTRPDLDNMAKALIDALQDTRFFENDSQIAMLTLEKWWSSYRMLQGVGIKIWELESDDKETV